ncbi:hypothetical protein GC170_20390 [bacterium]|nr:hypothetical protein [bacterium]
MNTTNANDMVLKELARLRADLEASLELQRANEDRLRATQRRLKATWAACFSVVLCGLYVAASPTAQAQFGITLASLNARLSIVENKTAPMTYDSAGKLLTISGANVMIIDGTGATLSTSGLGNLQIGYNQLRGGTSDLRTGSHNLILGDRNNYTSFGGIVSGFTNELTGAYAGIVGGYANYARGESSAVLGGLLNEANATYASVSGGAQNRANAEASTVSGGAQNTASNYAASVSGGVTNTASGFYSSVSGGQSRSATGFFNWAAGTYSSAN